MGNVAIVAIPREDDPVWRYSSEKVPHMTLLMLGESLTNAELYGAALYVQHVAKTTMQPFEMLVDKRGPLGDKPADVLFFKSDRGYAKGPTVARNYLLADDSIQNAYLSIDQYPEWTPHLTMGYPETPSSSPSFEPVVVQFNRLALWTGEYEGPEFRLEYPISEGGDFAMSDDAIDFLAHFGVKGMKWGTRHDNGHQGERVKTKKLAKLDKQYEKSFTGTAGFFKVHNEVAGQMNQRLDGLNAKYKDTNLNLWKPTAENKSTNDAYLKDYEDTVAQSVTAAMSSFGTNASGTHRARITKVGQGAETWYQSDWEEIKHADSPGLRLKITPKLNARGLIISQTIEDLDAVLAHKESDFLAHFGVKGMKWGVTREPAKLNTRAVTVRKTGEAAKMSLPITKQGKYQRKNADTAVTVVHTPGKRLTTKGGSNRKPSEDAIKAAASRRIARSSTTDALSTKELQDLVSRMNLEQQYSKLTAPTKSNNPATNFLKGVLGIPQNVVTTQGSAVGNEFVKQQLIKKNLLPKPQEKKKKDNE